MATYDSFERKVQALMKTGCSIDSAINQVKKAWSDAEEAARYALLAKQRLR